MRNELEDDSSDLDDTSESEDETSESEDDDAEVSLFRHFVLDNLWDSIFLIYDVCTKNN